MARRGENIRRRKDGRWEGRYHAQEPQTGKRVSRSIYGKTYGEVREKLMIAKRSEEALAKEQAMGEGICFGTVAEEWLSIIMTEKKHATYMKYRMVYEKHLQDKIADISFSELDGERLAGMFQSGEKECFSDSLQKSISCVLNQILSHAVSRYQIRPLQYSSPKNRTGARPIEVLDSLEQARLLRYLYEGMDVYKLGIILCISTGLRLGEICSLKWKDIDLEDKMLYVNTTVQRIAVEGRNTRTELLEGEPKSLFSKREIPLSDELTKLLSLYHSDIGEYVLNKTRPMEPRTYQNRFKKYLEMAKIKHKNFHALRHTFATNCVSSGVDIKSLSEILGHSDVKITLNRYVHPTLETKRQHMNSLAAIYGQFLGQQ
ncbi:MAG: site-specific integrase [Firmicutes bacterium]|nr:site-specific integrase [Bacillota bacterium]NBI64042.1 site-specific integrase [Clostridiales bacterium]